MVDYINIDDDGSEIPSDDVDVDEEVCDDEESWQ